MGKIAEADEPIKVVTKPDFELLVGEQSGEASIPVRWCVPANVREELRAQGVLHKAMMLLMVVHRESEQYWMETKRYLTSLTQEMCRVAFSRAGHNRVYGLIVWPVGRADGFDLSSEIMGTQRGVYKHTLMDTFTGDIQPGWLRKGGSRAHIETFEVEVDEKFFAKPMSKFARAILAKWNMDNPFDRCEKRKNIVPATILTMLAIPFAYIAKILGAVLFGLIGLFRGIDWSMLWHPMEQGSLQQMFSEMDDPWWFFDDRGNARGKVGQWYAMVWSPYLIFLGGLAVFGISNAHWTHHEIVQDFLGWGWWFCLAVSAAFFTAVVLITFLIKGLIIAVPAAFGGLAVALRWFFRSLHLNTLAGKISVSTKRRGEKRSTKRRTEAISRTERALIRMECHVGEVSFRAIDRSTKTLGERFHLKVDEWKPKARCLPYQR